MTTTHPQAAQPLPLRPPVSRKPRFTCPRCQEVRPIVGRGLCGRCWHAAKQLGELARWPKQVRGGRRAEPNRPPLPTLAPVPLAPVPPAPISPPKTLMLKFSGGDLALLEQLTAAAERQRRTPEGQLLCWLEVLFEAEENTSVAAAGA